MDAARRAAAAFLAAGLLAQGARAQGEPPSAPIPYAELVRPSRAPAAHASRPHPKAGSKPQVAGSPPPGAPAPPAVAAASGGTATSSGPAILRPATAPAPAALRVTPLAAPPAPATPPPAGARLAPGATAPPAEVEAFVDAALARHLAEGHGVGAVVAVVQNGQVVVEKGYGWADRAARRRFDPATTGVRLGSASRLLTGLLVLKLAEAGRLDLAASVDAALPAALRLPPEGFARTPRLGEVLQQRGGFEAREFGRAYLPEERLLPLDEGLRRLRAHRVRDPGGPAIAGDYGMALAGDAAAHAAGAGFETLAERELFAPAGLTSTSFREPRAARDGLPAPLGPALAARLAQGYAWSRDGAQPRPYGFAGALAPSLAATSTADDMARLMLVELAGGRTAAGAVLWGPRAQAWLHAGPAAGEPLSGQAYGRDRVRLPGGFAGFGATGGAPGFSSRYLIVPQLGLGVFVAANSEAAGVVDGLAPELVARFYAGAGETQATPDSGRGAGLYLDAQRAYHGLEGFVDRLDRLVRVRPAQDGLVERGLGRAQVWRATSADDLLHATDGAELQLLGVRGDGAEAVAEPGRAGLAERVGWLHRPSTLAASATLAAVAALLVLGGLCARLGREGARPTGQQAAASAVQVVSAVGWLATMAAFAVFRGESGTPGDLVRRWPDPWLVAASVAALASAGLTLVQLLQLPATWAEGRRLSGWAAGRKLRHTLSVLVFAAFAAVLASWGALEPWSS